MSDGSVDLSLLAEIAAYKRDIAELEQRRQHEVLFEASIEMLSKENVMLRERCNEYRLLLSQIRFETAKVRQQAADRKKASEFLDKRLEEVFGSQSQK